MVHVLFWSFASLLYEQSNNRVKNIGFVASQIFVSCFQGCFQHAGQVSTQTPLNFFTFAWQVLGSGLRPPCCMDSLSRDPGPVAPRQSSKADSFKEWLLGVSETLAGKKRSSSNYGLASLSHWLVPFESTGCVRTVSSPNTVQLVHREEFCSWWAELSMTFTLKEKRKKYVFYVFKKVYIQLIALRNSFHKDWAWGNASFGKFSLNLQATHVSHRLDISTLDALFSANFSFHFPVCSCAVDLFQNIFFQCDSSSFLRESTAYSNYSKSIYPGKYLDM